MIKLELTEPRMHAMAVELKAFGGWTLETCHKAVAAVIAAANSVPEGVPVGTGALQPGGAFVAIRVAGPYWTYVNVNQDDDAAWPHPDAADSWPVIYDPREDEAPRLAEAAAKPSPFCDAHGMRGSGIVVAADSNQFTVNASDPTAQQEPEAFNRFPGIENPTTSDYIGAAVADEQLKLVFALRDLRKERGMEIAEVAEAADVLASEISMFESGSSNPTLALVRRYAKAVGAVFTVDVRKWEDTQPQQEPEDPGPPSNAHIEFSKPARTPRVVDRLGVDEQGSRWQDRQLGEWKFDGQAWRYLELTWTSVPGGEWVEAEPSKRYGPYVEVLS